MDFLELVKKRVSVRSYTDKAVEPQKLDYILECARLAPSACNLQPWYFLVIQSEGKKKDIRACYDREWFKSAPAYLLACSDLSQSWKRKCDGKEHADVDIAIAFEHICLAAAEQGLGTCWVCNFDVELCRELFALPENMQPVAITPLGYPSEKESPRTSRKELKDIVNYL